MEKRLRIAQDLLKPDGVLIVTVDEHESNHLGVLLEDTFEDTYQQRITIVVTARGVASQGLARVEEYALYTYFGSGRAIPTADDFLSGEKGQSRNPWASLLRRGTNASPSDRPGLVYPILIDPETNSIKGVGDTVMERVRKGELDEDTIDLWVPERTKHEAWPIRKDGRLGTWQVKPSTLLNLLQDGYCKLGRYDEMRNSWAVNYLKSGQLAAIRDGKLLVTGHEWPGGPAILKYADDDDETHRAKTVWRRVAHDAGTYGSNLLIDFLGARIFDFPKSLYAVRDTLATIVGQNKDALILDFFAGSGTTLHSTALLNAHDGGNRRCILVTNNEVGSTSEAQLLERGIRPGDQEWSDHGIFSTVTKPRVEAAISGIRSDGKPVPGSYLEEYLDDWAHADGFDERVCFFELEYLDRDKVTMGGAFAAVAPMLWMASGTYGDVPETSKAAWIAPPDSHLAILLLANQWRKFIEQIRNREDLTHVFIVTDSEATYVQIASELPSWVAPSMLYRDYLSSFEINRRMDV